MTGGQKVKPMKILYYTGENVAPLDEEHRGRLKAVLEEHLPLEVSIALTAHA